MVGNAKMPKKTYLIKLTIAFKMAKSFLSASPIGSDRLAKTAAVLNAFTIASLLIKLTEKRVMLFGQRLRLRAIILRLRFQRR